ncbi:sensor histidine kinase [Flavobacterium maritimum]|uniref:sensor histidine kinase n=1 Tax=Flavobacterium maritimum TaxID=3149042 RepID=UPI0032B4CF0F
MIIKLKIVLLINVFLLTIGCDNSANNIEFKSDDTKNIDDSIRKIEKETENRFAEIVYETDQQEEVSVVLSKRNMLLGIGAGMIILFSGVFFAIYLLKSKNKELLFVKERYKENEKIYQMMLDQQLEEEKAKSKERNHIAMELHDGVVNSIFTTRFNLMQLDTNAFEKKQELVQELEKAANEIRRVSHDLSKNLLFEDKSFSELLNNLVESQQSQCDTKIDLSVDKYIDWSKVTSINKINLYRVIEEAIQNTSKYSKADKCYVMLLKNHDKIKIRIWDNGIGFNPESVKQGLGLKNIKERTKELKGELEITSRIGSGTTIEMVF